VSGKEWMTLALFVGSMVALAQFSPEGALALTLVVGLIIGVRSLGANKSSSKGGTVV
jgi:hypothetical protein